MMKKRSLRLVFCMLLSALHTVAYAENMAGIGAAVYTVKPYQNNSTYTDSSAKKAVHTDIVAYINGHAIPSYNINSYTGIVAEELENYGFDVDYNNNARQLRIEYKKNKEVTANYVPPKNTKPIGSFAANVYQTDIETYINNKRVTAFNIGGKTIVLMDSLANFGDVLWYPNERKICFDYVAPWSMDIPTKYDENRTNPAASFTIEMVKKESGEFEITGENYNYFSNAVIGSSIGDNTYFDFAIYQNVMDYTSELRGLLNKMYTFNVEGKRIKENANFANEHIEFYVNDKKFPIAEVREGKGNGHQDWYFSIDTHIRSLDEVQSIKIICK